MHPGNKRLLFICRVPQRHTNNPEKPSHVRWSNSTSDFLLWRPFSSPIDLVLRWSIEAVAFSILFSTLRTWLRKKEDPSPWPWCNSRSRMMKMIQTGLLLPMFPPHGEHTLYSVPWNFCPSGRCRGCHLCRKRCGSHVLSLLPAYRGNDSARCVLFHRRKDGN